LTSLRLVFFAMPFALVGPVSKKSSESNGCRCKPNELSPSHRSNYAGL